MFSITPRLQNDFGLLRLVDELINPWDLRSPMLYRDGSLANLSGKLGDSEVSNECVMLLSYTTQSFNPY